MRPSYFQDGTYEVSLPSYSPTYRHTTKWSQHSADMHSLLHSELQTATSNQLDLTNEIKPSRWSWPILKHKCKHKCVIYCHLEHSLFQIWVPNLLNYGLVDISNPSPSFWKCGCLSSSHMFLNIISPQGPCTCFPSCLSHSYPGNKAKANYWKVQTIKILNEIYFYYYFQIQGHSHYSALRHLISQFNLIQFNCQENPQT